MGEQYKGMGKSVVTYSSRICHLLALMAPLGSHVFHEMNADMAAAGLPSLSSSYAF